MDEKCKFCGKQGLSYDYDEDGVPCLVNTWTRIPHSCKGLRKGYEENRFSNTPGFILGEPTIDRIMRDYIEETRMRMPQYNSFCYDTNDRSQ